MSHKDYLTPAMIAKTFKVSPTTVHRWIAGVRCGSALVTLAAQPVGDRYRISQAALDVFLQDCLKAKQRPQASLESPHKRTRRGAEARAGALRACGIELSVSQGGSGK